jgi:pyruvate dehydrogenase E2 component (dihydrolipoamide acetyltransferase)
MPQEFTLPELGENIEKGDVIRVLVSPGDELSRDQPVLELETDKATIEVPSTVAGKIQEVRVKAGDKVKVGQVVLVVDASGNGQGARAAEPAPPAAASEPQAGERAPAAASASPARPAPPAARGEASKDPDEAGALAREATDASLERQLPGRGEAKAPPRQAAVVDIAAGRSAAPSRAEAGESPEIELAPPIPAAPSVRRFARELGVEIGGVPGTGPGGRIGQQDVKSHVKTLLGGGVLARAGLAQLPDFSKWGPVERTPMTNIRRKTAEHLTVAWQAPHVTQHDKADVTALEEFRQTYGPRVEKAGGKLTVTAIVIRLLAGAIDRFPQFASSVDMAGESLIVKHYRHIGVAVDTPNGLLVPVVREADRKSITEIAVELAALSQKARDRRLTLDDMAGGVMSVTNVGGIGGTYFTPIINQPEVAILGISRTATEPIWRNGDFEPRQMLPLSLSYDHRAIDGADAVRFLRFVAEGLEQPMTMYL